ncbi:MAG TPA: hypothetical protein VFZ59_06015 [Verrucomicrobiae bacterium]|nr:hypothetical protein [Verrucomicrobiae bacterium]
MKPGGGRISLVSRSLDLHRKQNAASRPTAQTRPLTPVEQYSQELVVCQKQRHTAFLRQQTLKKAVSVIRSKSKTRRLVELCQHVRDSVLKSDAWLAKYEKFFRSPVWKLVTDEAIRKANYKCECWGCTGRAVQVHLLEFPEEHLEPNFDWMNRDNILIALCRHHHEMMHRFVMKKVVLSDRQFSSAVPGMFAGNLRNSGAKRAPSPMRPGG